MRQHRRWNLARRLLAILLVAVLSMGLLACSRGDRPVQPQASPKPRPASVSRLAEVAPPDLLQTLRQEMDIYQPQVKILNLRPNQVLEDDRVELRFQVRDLPIFKDSTLGLGPHLNVILDNEPYRPVYTLDAPLVLAGLAPGTHTLRVFASRPWHESFKNEGAYAQLTFHVFTKTGDNTPDPALPLLTYSHPVGTYGAEPILLDFVLTNAPLHLIAQERSDDDIKDWKLRCTINGESFTFDTWQPIYLTGLKPGKNWVQLELIDEDGKAIANTFNNTVRVIHYEPGGNDTLSQLTRNELSLRDARAIIIPNYVPPPSKPETTPEPDQAPGIEAPEPEAPGIETPGPEAPGLEAPGLEAPALEEPPASSLPPTFPEVEPTPDEPLTEAEPTLEEPAPVPTVEPVVTPELPAEPVVKEPLPEAEQAPVSPTADPRPIAPSQAPEKPGLAGLRERINRLLGRGQPVPPTVQPSPAPTAPAIDVQSAPDTPAPDTPAPDTPASDTPMIQEQPPGEIPGMDAPPNRVSSDEPDGIPDSPLEDILDKPATIPQPNPELEEAPPGAEPSSVPVLPSPEPPATESAETTGETATPVPAIAPAPAPSSAAGDRPLVRFLDRFRRPNPVDPNPVDPVRPAPVSTPSPGTPVAPDESLAVPPDFELDVDDLPKALPENLFIQPEPIQPTLQIPAELVSPGEIPAPPIPAESPLPELPDNGAVEDREESLKEAIDDGREGLEEVPMLTPESSTSGEAPDTASISRSF